MMKTSVGKSKGGDRMKQDIEMAIILIVAGICTALILVR